MRKLRTIVIHHTAGMRTDTVDDIRREHLRRGYSDIGYHYLITPEGEVFNGRPLKRVGAHAKGHNADSIGVAMIGNYDEERPTERALEALEGLIDYLRQRYGVDQVLGHQELGKTGCPGRHLMRWLQEWRLKERMERDKGV